MLRRNEDASMSTLETTQYLDVAHVAALLGKHRVTIRRWIKREGLRAIKIRRGPYMVRSDELRRFLQERER